MAAEDSAPLDETNCDWLALRYVGDEMTAVERTEFEALLAESQEAREAVAAAVLMFTAVPLALADSSIGKVTVPVKPPMRRPWLRRVGWAAVGAAACLAAMLGVETFRHRSAPVGQAIAADGKDPGTQAMRELALHWTSLAGEANALGTESNPDADNAEAAPDEIASADAGPSRDSNESVDELVAPSWLLAAVAPIVGPPAHDPPASE
jgi:hypothetical protein